MSFMLAVSIQNLRSVRRYGVADHGLIYGAVGEEGGKGRSSFSFFIRSFISQAKATPSTFLQLISVLSDFCEFSLYLNHLISILSFHKYMFMLLSPIVANSHLNDLVPPSLLLTDSTLPNSAKSLLMLLRKSNRQSATGIAYGTLVLPLAYRKYIPVPPCHFTVRSFQSSTSNTFFRQSRRHGKSFDHAVSSV